MFYVGLEPFWRNDGFEIFPTKKPRLGKVVGLPKLPDKSRMDWHKYGESTSLFLFLCGLNNLISHVRP